MYAYAVVFRAEVVFQNAVFAFALLSQVATHHFVHHHGVQTAGRQVHQSRHVVAESLEFLEAFVDGRVLLDGVDCATAFLGTHNLLRQIGLGLDLGSARHQNDLMVSHIRLGEVDVLLALFGDGQAVPQNIYTLAVQFSFLGAPVDRLEFDFDAKTLGGFTGQVNIETHQLVFFVTETHGGEVVVQTDDNLAGFCRRRRFGLCGGVIARTAGGQEDSGGCQKNTSQFFHFSRVQRTK